MTKLSTLLLAGVAVGAIAAVATPAVAGICPTTGTATTDCNFFYHFNSNGSISTTLGTTNSSFGNYSYDFAGGEDALIGVINNSGHSITSISLNGGASNIFGFDGDGIGAYGHSGTNASDTSSGNYGGLDAFFTNIVGNTGTVNFIGGIASGSTGYFSLEEPVSISAPPTVTGQSSNLRPGR